MVLFNNVGGIGGGKNEPSKPAEKAPAAAAVSSAEAHPDVISKPEGKKEFYIGKDGVTDDTYRVTAHEAGEKQTHIFVGTDRYADTSKTNEKMQIRARTLDVEKTTTRVFQRVTDEYRAADMKPVPLFSGFFETNSADVAKAGTDHSRADVDDAMQMADAQVKRVKDFLKDNPTARLTVTSYASAAGNASYNQTLSEQRAEAMQQVLMEKLGAEYADRVDVKLVARGESAAIGAGDDAFDRRVDVAMEQEDAGKRVVHLDKKDIADLNEKPFSVKLNSYTIKDEKLGKVEYVGAVADLQLDEMPTEPLKLHVVADHPTKFKLLLPESNAKIAYKMMGNQVIVTADGKTVAELDYNTKVGGKEVPVALSAEDVLIATVGADRTPNSVGRDSAGEKKDILTAREKLAAAIDTDKDGLVEPKEVAAYQQKAEIRAKFTDLDGDRGAMVAFTTRGKSSDETALTSAAVNQFATDKEARAMDKMFASLLEANNFEKPMTKVAFAEAAQGSGHGISGQIVAKDTGLAGRE